jgi:hypothetical protein
MYVTSIRYRPVEGGALGGHFALHVTLGTEVPSGFFTPTDLSTRIHDIFEKLGLQSKVKGVLLDCREGVGDAAEMLALLQTLKDWSYTLILWVNEEVRYSWFDPSYYITVFVRSQHWPNFRVNEIRYLMPEEEAQWAEPDVYDVNAASTCYVLPPGLAGIPQVVKFTTGCKRPWGIIGRSASIAFMLKEA